MKSIFKHNLIRMQLKQESLVILLIFIIIIRILLESTTSEKMIMLTFNNVKCRSLISDQLQKVSMSEFLFWPPVKKRKFKVNTIKPCFEMLPVLLHIDQ